MKSNYLVVYSEDLEQLCLQVQRHMNDGYIPCGGVAIQATLGKNIYIQALFIIKVYNHQVNPY